MLLEQPATRRPRATIPKKIWIPVLALVALIGAGAVFLAVRFPFTRKEVTKAVGEATAQSVQIRTFRKTYFPPGCVAEDLTLMHGKHRLGVIRKLEIRGSYLGMISSPKRIPEVRITGMRLLIPRKDGDGQGGSEIPLASGKGGKPIAISKIVADGALLEFESKEPDGKPYLLKIEKLGILGVGTGQPWSYRTTLVNSEPPGVIRSQGKFGPWNSAEPLRTLVQGNFTYDDVDLGVFDGISGRLSAKGQFQGTLGRIEASG